jgi:hypothetical protein
MRHPRPRLRALANATWRRLVGLGALAAALSGCGTTASGGGYGAPAVTAGDPCYLVQGSEQCGLAGGFSSRLQCSGGVWIQLEGCAPPSYCATVAAGVTQCAVGGGGGQDAGTGTDAGGGVQDAGPSTDAGTGGQDSGSTPGTDTTTFKAITAGGYHTCGLQQSGKVLCWGDDDFGQSTPPSGESFVAITAGEYHTCGLQQSGKVLCWGKDDDGQSTPPSDESFVAITAGIFHTCGLQQSGKVLCWGKHNYGQSTPPSGESFVAITAGYEHTCGLQQSGKVLCWGAHVTRHEIGTT